MIKILTLIIIVLCFFYFFFIKENFDSSVKEYNVLNVEIRNSDNTTSVQDIKLALNDKTTNLEVSDITNNRTTASGASDENKTTASGASDENKTTASGASDENKTTSSGASDENKTTSSGTSDENKTTSSGTSDENKTTSSGASDENKTTSSGMGEEFTNFEQFQNTNTIIIQLKFDKVSETKLTELWELLKLKFKDILEIIEIIKKEKIVLYNKNDSLLTDVLTNKSCIDKQKQCNLAYRPYKELEFNRLNPKTNKSFTNNEIVNIKTLFNNKCDGYKNSNLQVCCNNNDKGIVIDENYLNRLDDKDKKKSIEETLEKYKYIDVYENNNTISSIRVCNETDIDKCGDGDWKSPDAYELCKLINLETEDYKDKKNVDISKLTQDCYTSFCNDDKYFTIENKNMDEMKTNHYYLIEAVKRDDSRYLENYYKNGENRDAQLKYGYGGNTIFHHAVYYKADKCIDYLIKYSNCKKHIVNKDLNNVLHIASLKGNYTCVDKLLKCGFSIDHKNKYGDTVLHCAVRSGSYNCVKILLDYNGFSNILIKNNYGETPLHTSVIPLRNNYKHDRMNYKIVEILVQYGGEIHTTNNLGETILKTLMNKNKSLEREKIRTFLQRQYYMKYDNDTYSKMLNSYPEIRPFELNTTLNGNFNKYSNNVDYKNIVEYSEDKLSNDDLYVNKDTYPLKDKIP